MIRLSGQPVCASVVEAEAIAMYLPDHVALTRAEPGCLVIDVVRTGNPLVWQVDEAFATEADFDAHRARTARSVWPGMTATVGRRYTITRD